MLSNKEVDQQHLQVQMGPRNSWHLVWDRSSGTVEGTSSRPLLKRKRPKSFQGCQPLEKPYHYILSLFRLRVRVILKRRVELPDRWPDWPHPKLQVLDLVFIVTTVVLNPNQTLQLKFPQVNIYYIFPKWLIKISALDFTIGILCQKRPRLWIITHFESKTIYFHLS